MNVDFLTILCEISHLIHTYIFGSQVIEYCTEVCFASFLSGGFTTKAVNKSTGKGTSKTHLCVLVSFEKSC